MALELSVARGGSHKNHSKFLGKCLNGINGK